MPAFFKYIYSFLTANLYDHLKEHEGRPEC